MGLNASETAPKNPSAQLLWDWIESDTFVWLITDEIVAEYKRVLARLGVRRSLIGKIVNLLGEEAELVAVARMPDISPIPEMIRFVPVLKLAKLISSRP